MKQIAFVMTNITFIMKIIHVLRIDLYTIVAKATTIHKVEPPKGGRRPKAAAPPILCIVVAFATVRENQRSILKNVIFV